MNRKARSRLCLLCEQQKTCDTKLHSKIEQGDQEDSDGGVLIVRRSRASAGNEAV